MAENEQMGRIQQNPKLPLGDKIAFAGDSRFAATITHYTWTSWETLWNVSFLLKRVLNHDSGYPTTLIFYSRCDIQPMLRLAKRSQQTKRKINQLKDRK